MVALQKKTGVGFQIVLDAKFDERLFASIDAGLADQMLQDAVFTVLRKNLELRVLQVVQWCAVGVLQGEGSSLQDHQVFNLAQRRRELPPGYTSDLLDDRLGD
jgi:hypothetical protein